MNCATLPHFTTFSNMVRAGTEWEISCNGWVWLHCTQGNAYWLSGATVIELLPGDTLVVVGGKNRVMRSSQLCDTAVTFFWFNGDSLSNLLSPHEREIVRQLLHDEYGAGTRINHSNTMRLEFARLLRTRNPQPSLRQKATILNLIVEFLAPKLPVIAQEESLGHNPATKFTHMMQSVTAQDLVNTPVEQWADRCGCTPKYFKRLYYHHFGITFRERVKLTRLEQAKAMISEGRLSAETVAKDCKFASYQSFAVQFKTQFGLTPEDYSKIVTRGSNHLSQTLPTVHEGGATLTVN